MLDKLRLALFHLTSWLARILLLAVATIAPWWYGGAQWESQTWLVSVGLWIAILTWLSTCLSPRRTSGCGWLSYLMVAFMLVVAGQVVPLPGFLASRLSGGARYVQSLRTAVAPVADSESGKDPTAQSLSITPDTAGMTQLETGLWNQPQQHRSLSIAPYQTQASLAVLALAVAVLWSAATLLVSKRWVIAMVVLLAASGLLNGLVGLFQLINHAGQTLLEMPKTESIFATFVSRNSAPAYYATCIGAALTLMGIAFRAQKRKRRKDYRVTYPGTSWLGRLRNRMEDVFIDLNSVAVTTMFVTIFMLVATLATFSRGGIIACVGAGLLTIVLTLGSRGDWARASALSGGLLVCILGMISFFEIGQTLWERLDQLNAVSGEDARLVVWGHALRALPSYWWGGCGFGSFRFAILPFHTGQPTVWFHHAESLPLEVWLETGLPGLLMGLAACWLIGQQLYLRSQLQDEPLLLAGTLFATAALAIQNLVDFNLILPGVFLPYCLLLGAFLGRCRRVEHEHAWYEELGPDASDARHRSRAKRAPSKGKLAGHSLVAGASVLCMLWGAPSLAGYARAGHMNRTLKQLSRSIESELEIDVNLVEVLENQAQSALQSYPQHPEVGLVVGQIEQQLWRLHATATIEWGNEYSEQQKREMANPVSMALVARSSEPALEPLQRAILSDSYSMQLAQASHRRFEQALLACPLDPRAAWGIYATNLGWLSTAQAQLLLENLNRLIRNNPTALTEIGLLALSDGEIEQGLAILTQAIAIDPNRLNRQTLSVIAAKVNEQQLKRLLAVTDPPRVAMTAKILIELARSPAQGSESAQELVATLAQQINQHAYRLLSQPQLELPAKINLDDYLVMAWVAHQAEDAVLEKRFIEQAVRRAPDSFALRMRLATLLYEAGQVEEAIRELTRFKGLSGSVDEQTRCEQQIEIWLGKVDQLR